MKLRVSLTLNVVLLGVIFVLQVRHELRELQRAIGWHYADRQERAALAPFALPVGIAPPLPEFRARLSRLDLPLNLGGEVPSPRPPLLPAP